MVCVEVGNGDASEEYFIHQGLIRARSGFFDEALKGPWKESAEHKITLKEEEAAIFAVNLELLYVSSSGLCTEGET